MIPLSLIADELNWPGAVLHAASSSTKTTKAPRSGASFAPNASSDFLYIFEGEADIDRIPSNGAPQSLVVVADEDPALPRSAYLFLPRRSSSASDTFSRIQAIFERYQFGFFYRLALSAMEDRDIEQLLEIAWPFFDNPLYVCDSAFQLIAATRQAPVNHATPQWTSLIEKGYLDPAITRKIKVADIDELDSMKRASFLYSVDAPKVRNIAAHIERNGVRIANLSVIGCEHPFCDHHLILADYLTHCIGCVLDATSSAQSGEGNLYERWLAMLMSGEATADNSITAHLENLKWSEDDCYQVALIDFLDKKTSGTNALDYYGRMLNRTVPGQKCFLYKDMIVMLLHGEPDDIEPWERWPAIESVILAHELRCAVSLPYHDILATAAHFAQARRIRSFATKAAPIVRFADVMLDDLIMATSFSKDWAQNIAPEVLSLMQEDRMGESNLVLTLYTYLKLDRSPAHCAKELNIHRNTLNYRISKMRERHGFDFDDPEKRLTYLISCRIALQREDDTPAT